MDDFELERDLEDAGIDAFDFSLMHEEEQREALEEAGLDPEDYEGASGGRLYSSPAPAAASRPANPDTPSKPTANTEPPEAKALRAGTAPPMRTYRYLQVRFSPGGRLYAYRTEDRTVTVGDQVVVPTGDENAPMLVTVVSAGDYAESVAPHPPEKTKFILRKATANELAPKDPDDTNAEKPPEEPTSTAKKPPHTEEDSKAENTPVPAAQSRKKIHSPAVVIVLLAVIAACLGCYLYIRQQDKSLPQKEAVNGAPSANIMEGSVPGGSPAPAAADSSVPRPTSTPRSSATVKSQTDAAPYVGQYVSVTQTSKWDYQGEWYDYKNTGKKVVGYYYRTGEHAYSIKVDPSTNRIVEVGVTDFSTPSPAKKNAAADNSDPYNAKDYGNPDFFYDDYYDDFYDYDEAEEYWEEYGDW